MKEGRREKGKEREMWRRDEERRKGGRMMVKMISQSTREGGCGERGKQACGQRRRAREEMRRGEGEERGLGVGREEARTVVG